VRRIFPVVLGLLLSAVLATSAHAALFFLFAPTSARPGDVVTVRLGGTPVSFTASKRKKPLRPAIRLYLGPAEEIADVRSRFDRRIHFIGSLVPDRNTHGLLSFTVPPLDAGTYAVAAWCPGCRRHSSGRAFFVVPIPRTSRYSNRMGLDISMPDARDSCPVTAPNRPGSGRFNHGNGLLVSTLPRDGVVVGAEYEPDGSLFWKPYWLPRVVTGSAMVVRGERLDAPSAPMRVLAVHWGSGSWATAATFPSDGCWRITGGTADIALSYVVKVVRP
jgi:hypothetical protein